MLRLILFRHAKSAWADSTLSDFDRPLAERGIAACPVMASAMSALGLAPQVILCSPARRTRETLDLVLAEPACDAWDSKVMFDRRLYLGEPRDIRTVLAERAAGATEVMVVGHNPGLQELAVALCTTGEPARLAALATKLPTAAVVVIGFTAADVSAASGPSPGRPPSQGRLEHFLTPAHFGAGATSGDDDGV